MAAMITRKTQFPRWELDDLSACAKFVVEASSFEQQTLWERFSSEAGNDNYRVDWKDQTRGWLIEVGQFNKQPVCIHVQGSLLNDVPVLFYDATSRVVHRGMIEEWFRERCWPKWDNDVRRAHCDAANFHLCLEVVRQ